MYKVQKKSGKIEDFDRNKILAGIIASGGSMEDAERVTDEVVTWLPNMAVNGIVRSIDIRNKGLEIFRNVNPTAADRFDSYEKYSV
jgi:hypothetical protein